ncbi:hypothetical protein [Ruminococcus sp.]|nr:hypothetical protein [Ruminococcus sp.]
MPTATVLESCDLTGKTIIPFCSHGGSTLDDISEWLKENGIVER